MIAAATSSLTSASRLTPADVATAKQVAQGLIKLNPKLQDPSSDFVTEIGNVSGAFFNLVAARFGGRDDMSQLSFIESSVRAIMQALKAREELNATEELMIQLAMARMAKFSVVLSRILKAISNSSQSMVSNLK